MDTFKHTGTYKKEDDFAFLIYILLFYEKSTVFYSVNFTFWCAII